MSSEPFTEILLYCHSVVELSFHTAPYLKQKAMYRHKSIYPSGMDLKAGESQICLIKVIIQYVVLQSMSYLIYLRCNTDTNLKFFLLDCHPVRDASC